MNNNKVLFGLFVYCLECWIVQSINIDISLDVNNNNDNNDNNNNNNNNMFYNNLNEYKADTKTNTKEVTMTIKDFLKLPQHVQQKYTLYKKLTLFIYSFKQFYITTYYLNFN